MKRIKYLSITQLVYSFIMTMLFSACASSKLNSVKNSEQSISQVITHSAAQYELLSKEALTANRLPRTLTKEGEYHWVSEGFDWTEGFYPGTCWYLFELTKDPKWKIIAENAQAKIEAHKSVTYSHDLGFIFNASYGNGYRITKNKDYRDVMLAAGNSLITRFNRKVGSIQSWNVTTGWQAQRNWKFPVIIDNMLNLELLFELSKLTGDPKYKEIAILHANTTLKNHFRADYSSFHVVDYDPETGEVRKKQTAQGFNDSSCWARGQAWGLYGYTVCYRYTRDPKYLAQAQSIAAFITQNDRIPNDKIPYWDYDAPGKPNALRDASAAAVTASALIELSQYTNKKYLQEADAIIKSLSSEAYLAPIGTNKFFLLKHSVGSIPHDNEIDQPLNYADYYFIEALKRRQEFKVVN